MFIQTETTPNPETLKFLPGRDVLGEGYVADFPNIEVAASSALAMQLFNVKGVAGVFFGSDFITVTKDTGEWPHLKPAILSVIMEHFISGAPIIFDEVGKRVSPCAEYKSKDSEIVCEIKRILDTYIRPAVAKDGGNITFQSYEAGIVFLKMQGSCAGCPSSMVTLKNGVENMLKHYIADVIEVRAV